MSANTYFALTLAIYMGKIQKHIEIVRTDCAGLSSMSEKSCASLFYSLQKNYETVGITTIRNEKDLADLVLYKPDLAFLGLKFIPKNPELGRADPDKIWISEYLEAHEIPYTGSNKEALARELDKERAKQCITDAGVRTAKFYVSAQNEPLNELSITLTYPLFVKPVDRGGGLGVDQQSLVINFDQLREKVSSIATIHKSDSLIEEYLPGREFSVAVLRDHDTDQFNVLPLELVTEANAKGERILSAELKSANEEQVLEVTDQKLKKSLRVLALRAFDALGADDYGRIDIRLDAQGKPNFLEANLIPCLIAGYGNFPKACNMYLGMDHEAMVLAIVNLALPNEPEDILLPLELQIIPA